MPEIIVFIVGLAAAIRGADWVGSSAIAWAKHLGIPNIVIGATLVSVATTLPELSVATTSGIFNRDPQIALGAVLGSPLANLGFILGVFLIFAKNRPTVGYFSRLINLFILMSFLLLIFSFYQPIGSLFSLLFIILGVMFIILEFVIDRRSAGFVEVESARFRGFFTRLTRFKKPSLIFEFALGTVLLAVGSKYLVDSTVALSNLLNINEFFISISLLAIGSSLPEFITAVTSIFRRREELSIGNLVGASLIDITAGTGLATLAVSSKITYPTNVFIFTPMLIIGFLCLMTLWKKIPLSLIGGLLIITAVISLGLFSIYEIF